MRRIFHWFVSAIIFLVSVPLFPLYIIWAMLMFIKKDTRKKIDKRYIIKTLLFIICLFSIRWLIGGFPQTDGYSMEPSILHSEYTLENRLAYKFNKPSRGDIITFKHSSNGGISYISISRIIALFGDTIKIKEGVVYLNDKPLQEDYVRGITMPSKDGSLKENEDFNISEDSIFVMSDNRQHASDSRSFGVVPIKNIIGKISKLNYAGTLLNLKSTDITGEDLYNAGWYFLNMKNMSKAGEYFTQASNNYKYVPAMIALGGIYFDTKDYEKAIQQYQIALEIDTDNPLALHNMAACYWNIGNKEKAIKYYNDALIAYEKSDLTKEYYKAGYDNLRAFMIENRLLK